MRSQITISKEVSQAMRSGHPVVALESAVITSGMPRTPLDKQPRCAASGWNEDQPINLEIARLMERTVRAHGAIPATVAVFDGQLWVGLDDAQLDRLAGDPEAGKVSAGGLAEKLRSGQAAGTTVSATLVACHRVGPIRVFATGGIGGMHRNWQTHPDVSGDLEQLSRTQTCIVCAGAKSILDISATLERMETLNIPVIGYQTDSFPRFHSLGDDSLPVPLRLDSVDKIAGVCQTHWTDLGQASGVLLANPIAAEFSLEPDALESAILRVEQSARREGVSGPGLTPYLLAGLNEETAGLALEANIALLAGNASLAALLAIALTR